jgi:hypothetical protein
MQLEELVGQERWTNLFVMVTGYAEGVLSVGGV